MGKNNSGKSSVLEALRIYAGGANRFLLTTIANGHDEPPPSEDNPFSKQDGVIPFESFFMGGVFLLRKEKLL